MKKKITIGGKEMAFEANLGTTRLYEILTGQNIMQVMMDFMMSNDKASEAVKMLAVFQRLAYIMNVQANNEDIKTMKGLMNEDDFDEWLFQLEAFSESDLLQIAALWSETQKTHSNNDSKNA